MIMIIKVINYYKKLVTINMMRAGGITCNLLNQHPLSRRAVAGRFQGGQAACERYLEHINGVASFSN